MQAPATPHELSLSLDAAPMAGDRARRALRSAYAKRLPQGVLFDLLSVVTELVNNSVEHGPRGPITVMVVLDGDVLRGEVKDGGSPKVSFPAIREASRDGDEDGRGLGLTFVDALTRRWAVFAGSTTVWFEMSATGGPK